MKLHVRSTLFRSPRSKLLAAGASFAAIALFVLILPATVASGDTSASTSTLDAGVLGLHLGAGTDDYFGFQPAGASGEYGESFTKQQSIGAAGCKLTLAGDALVSLSAGQSSGSPFPGFVSDAIGIGAKNEGTGQPCGRIDPTQKLNLGIGSGLSGKLIEYAEIDLEGKFGASVLVEGYLGSSATPVASEDYATSGPDSSPDSADLDNFRIRFPVAGTTLVDRIVISIIGSTGGASLEGGSDGTNACDGVDANNLPDENSLGCATFSLGQDLGTRDTLFHLVEVDGFLDCGQTAPTQGGNGTPANTLERLENATGTPAECEPIPFNLDSSFGTEFCSTEDTNFLQCILLQKDLLGQDAQFYWTVTWAPEPGEYQESDTQFDFGNGPQDLQLCLADAAGDGFPDLPPTASIADPPTDVDPWCVVETSTVLQFDPVNGETFVVVKEKYFGSGDPAGKRG
jgi:hypothetical protein